MKSITDGELQALENHFNIPSHSSLKATGSSHLMSAPLHVRTATALGGAECACLHPFGLPHACIRVGWLLRFAITSHLSTWASHSTQRS